MWSEIKKTEDGDFIISKCELEQLLIDASRQGAKKALSELGLDDENARTDIHDMRELLMALRMAKKDSFRIFVRWLVVGIMTLITAGFISLLSKSHHF